MSLSLKEQPWSSDTFLELLNQACSETSLQYASDLVIASLHTCFFLAEFQLQEIESLSSTTSTQLTTTTTTTSINLPKSWNSVANKYLALTYKRLDDYYKIKFVPLGSHVLVHGICMDNEQKICSLDLEIYECVLPEISFPNTSPPSSLLKNEDKSIDQLMQQCKEFISSLTSTNILSPQAATSSASPRASSLSKSPKESNFPRTSMTPLTYPSVPSLSSSQRSPFSIGHRDLDPLGGIPPVLAPPFGGSHSSSVSPLGSFDGNDGGGNIMGPEHPLFRREDHPSPLRSDWNRDARLPPGSVPMGARFDPILPGSLPPRGGPHGLPPFSGIPGQPRGGGKPPFSGEPDNDMFPPPGYNDMFM